MDEDRRELRAWRERAATLPKGPGEEKPATTRPDKPDKLTNPDSLRVSLSETSLGQTAEKPDKPPFVPSLPHFEAIGPDRWVLTPYAWAHCVSCDAELVEGERMNCAACRAKIDVIRMPWDDHHGETGARDDG